MTKLSLKRPIDDSYVTDYRETGRMTLDLRHRFAAGRGYLGAATLGLPADVTVAALRRDVETYATGTVDVMEYTALVEKARGYAARLPFASSVARRSASIAVTDPSGPSDSARNAVKRPTPA